MTSGAWSRSVLGRVISTARRATPRLERFYAQLPASAGLTPGDDEAGHQARLVRYLQFLAEHTSQLPDRPSFSILITGAADREATAQTLASLRLQVWPDWQVVLSPDVLAADPDDHVVRAPRADDPQGRLTGAFAQATGDYVWVLEPGDRLYPSALAEVARAIDLEKRLTGSRPQALYCDERTLDQRGGMRGDPVLKPAWSPRLLRGHDYVGAAVYERTLLADLGGPRSSPAGRHDLALRAGARCGFQHVPQVLLQRRSTPLRRSAPAPATTGRASVIIPTRDRADLLRACVRSVLDRTDHGDFEVLIVDNGTTQPDAVALLTDLARDSRVQVLTHPGPFNFARLCNAGVAAASGTVIVLLNNDTEVISPGWLSVLTGWAQDDGVGAVGAQLRYPDGRIQHAGIVGLADAGTGHVFVARDPAAESPLGLATAAREVLAVTGACLAVRRDHYLEVGGLDEWVVPNDSGDVDLCLRLRERGLENVYAPDAVLVHHESPSRGRSFVDFERQYMLRRWPADMLRDPYLNPHLSRSTRYEADPRFGLPEVPPPLFDAWLAAGRIPGVSSEVR